ncbi:MAG: hypothetical protein AAFP13_13140 [Pseudomonadota bacterium]
MDTEDCTGCARLRFFLPVALMLIAAIYAQPAWAIRLAGFMPAPMSIGVAILLANVLGVVWGLWRRNATAIADARNLHRTIAEEPSQRHLRDHGLLAPGKPRDPDGETAAEEAFPTA